jgi:hypothetical protein
MRLEDLVFLLDEDLDLSLRLIKFLTTEMGEANPLLKQPQGLFQIQISVLKFGNDPLQPS